MALQLDLHLKRTLWYLIGGSRGGVHRAKIIMSVKNMPQNANQLAKELGLNYKTIRHHLKLLVQNQILIASGKDEYGMLYFLSPRMEQSYAIFEEIWARIVHK